jgi:hypothetical protein
MVRRVSTGATRADLRKFAPRAADTGPALPGGSAPAPCEAYRPGAPSDVPGLHDAAARHSARVRGSDRRRATRVPTASAARRHSAAPAHWSTSGAGVASDRRAAAPEVAIQASMPGTASRRSEDAAARDRAQSRLDVRPACWLGVGRGRRAAPPADRPARRRRALIDWRSVRLNEYHANPCGSRGVAR